MHERAFIGIILLLLFISCLSVNLSADYKTQQEFITINDGTNHTTVISSTPIFNWTVVSGASEYTLQISNTSDWLNPEVNITDINPYNYPLYCDVNSTRVSFTLPSGNALSRYHTYYCRVQANIKNM